MKCRELIRTWIQLGALVAMPLAGIECLSGESHAGASDSVTNRGSMSHEETDLWHQADKLDEAIQLSGALIDEPELTSYLQDVVDRLFPDFRGTIRVFVLQSTVPNAFALANGSVYLDLGILVQLDNEAQLAAVLGHEGTHFARGHRRKFNRSARQKMMDAALLGTTMGVPDPDGVLAYSSLMGYSRKLERQADEDGARRMQRAGYDVKEGSVMFERLARNAKHVEYEDPVFFASHPAMSERAQSFRKMSASTKPGGILGEQAYAAHVEKIIAVYLADEIQQANYRAVIFLLQEEGRLDSMPPGSRFYLAEAYRLRGEEGDLQLAAAQYRRAIAEDPEIAVAYSSLGKLLMKLGQNEEAAENLKRYLVLAPEAPDRAYVESYLERLSTDE